MTPSAALGAAPAAVRASARRDSIRVEPLTCSIDAELGHVSLADAARDAELFAEIHAPRLEHKVLFLREQDFTRAEHVAFARRFGPLEDHPVLGSDPVRPGLVPIYEGADTRHLQYEDACHCDVSWRECPPMGAVLRCVECPPVGGCFRHDAVDEFFPAVRKLERAGIVGERPY